jgi:acetyltransferase-like isoleucine patch superfamily enzyme
MIRDHRPYFIKKGYLKFQEIFTRRFVRPQLSALGRGPHFVKPWHVEIFGAPVSIGNYATLMAAPDDKIRLTVWPAGPDSGAITIGDYCMICPGVRIGSAKRVVVADNCMLAGRVYVTDCDWHGLYDRLAMGPSEPVFIGPNAWIGFGALVCKGVTIGENSVVGAGAVVVDDVPPNTVAAGNPARVVKKLDPRRPITTRAQWLANPEELCDRIDRIDRDNLSRNTLRHWIKQLVFPRRGGL